MSRKLLETTIEECKCVKKAWYTCNLSDLFYNYEQYIVP